MRIFDPHIHMTRAHDRRLRGDVRRRGARASSSPRSGSASPARASGSFVDYFDALIGWERFRAAQYGIRHHATIGLNPKEANDPRCREVLDVLPATSPRTASSRSASSGTTR